MMLDRSTVGVSLCIVLALYWHLTPMKAFAGTQEARKKAGKVWIVFFSSPDCPRCESVKLLVEALKSTYPLRVKSFDVSRKRDYSLFRQLERIHGEGEFAVPLVMIGEQILEGEADITDKLENSIKRLSHAGGARLPYLGGQGNKSKAASNHEHRKLPSFDEARPPTLGEELNKIRVLLNKLLSNL